MALSDKNIVITPNTGSSTADPTIVFTGASSTTSTPLTVTVYPTSNGTIAVTGSAGQLFSITNNLSGTLFSVNDISGIPSIEVLDTGIVKLAQYSGNVLIGYGSSNGSAYALQVNSQIFATNATVATSDRNYKTNITPLDDGLALVRLFNPVMYDWKDHPIHNFEKNTTLGFVAQDMLAALKNTKYVNSVVKVNTCILPDGTKEQFLGLAEDKVIPILTKAIQQLADMVDELKKEIEDLKK